MPIRKTTKRAAFQEVRRLCARKKTYRSILALRGTVHWEGDPRSLRKEKGR